MPSTRPFIARIMLALDFDGTLASDSIDAVLELYGAGRTEWAATSSSGSATAGMRSCGAARRRSRRQLPGPDRRPSAASRRAQASAGQVLR